MMGDGTDAGKGMIPRIASVLLQRMRYLYHDDPECHIQVSFLEIYQERIRDLLTTTSSNMPASFPGTSESLNGDLLGSVQETRVFTDDVIAELSPKDKGVQQVRKAINFTSPPSKRTPKTSADRSPVSPSSPKSPTSPKSPSRSPCHSPLSSPKAGQEKLKIREHPKLGPYVVGLTRRFVSTWGEMKDALHEGQAHRTVGATVMNKHSSRSHTVFTMTITQVRGNTHTFLGNVYCIRFQLHMLHVIDLHHFSIRSLKGKMGWRANVQVRLTWSTLLEASGKIEHMQVARG
eukprot:TRINITY_DN5591_c0_g1_i1.p1 TRINITY_DN5591_c0_g1~~TRINITY_DN5591_c0_g1_i1.p1  ORF type:complete len:290 (+),score=17.30 TRINITY_DN5591_c0_g1_i1:678-1547(+)